MQLRHLRYFVKIVEAGSFSRAAATIHVAQPALSQQMAELEDKLGVTLLHRSSRGVLPTPAGETLYREANAILRQMEKLPGIVRSSVGEAEGAVSIGISSTLASFLAGPLLDACRKSLPGISLRLVSADSVSLKSRIDAETLDLAIVYEDEPTPGFDRKLLFRQRFYLVRRTPLPGGAAAISMAELASLPLILPSHPNMSRALFDRAFAAAGQVPNMVLEADILSSMLSAVQSGIGDTLIPKGDFSDVPGHGDLHAIPIDPPLCLTAAILASNEVPLTRASELVQELLITLMRHHTATALPPGADWIGLPHIESR